jgi:hypothetical protein
MTSDRVPLKHPYISGRKWALWQWMDIPSKINRRYVYLRRLRAILTPPFGIYIHWIFEPDADRDPHDHPRPFISVILRGCYAEDIYPYAKDRNFSTRRRVWKRWSVHRMRIGMAHKIVLIQPDTISLLLVGRKGKRDWGFYTAAGFVPQREYSSVVAINKDQELEQA